MNESSAGQVSRPKSRPKDLRPLHRIVGSIILVFTLYFGLTGLIVQSIDLRAIAFHVPATDPEMLAIRESIDGTPNFAVIRAADYAQAALPGGFDFADAFTASVRAARSALAAHASVRYAELRMSDGKPVGIVGVTDDAGAHQARVDPATGALLSIADPPAEGPTAPSLHGSAKRWHRLQSLGFGDEMEWLNGLIGICLFLMIITGVIVYFRLLQARRRAGLKSIFWPAGGRWRSLHRSIAIVAAAFLVVVSVTGTLLSIDSFALGIYIDLHQSPGKHAREFPAGMTADFSSPLQDSELAGMAHRTLNGFRAIRASTPIKVIRLRYLAACRKASSSPEGKRRCSWCSMPPPAGV